MNDIKNRKNKVNIKKVSINKENDCLTFSYLQYQIVLEKVLKIIIALKCYMRESLNNKETNWSEEKLLVGQV